MLLMTRALIPSRKVRSSTCSVFHLSAEISFWCDGADHTHCPESKSCSQPRKKQGFSAFVSSASSIESDKVNAFPSIKYSLESLSVKLRRSVAAEYTHPIFINALNHV